jgi:kinesin family protein 22
MVYTYTFFRSFDACYDDRFSQQDLYSREVEPYVPQMFSGLNTTIFCFGMTGTGKTHTMQGSKTDPGIISRSVMDIVSRIKTMEQQGVATDVSLTFSFLEIYNEKVYDLLDPKPTELPVREDSNNNVIVSNLAEQSIDSYETFCDLYALGTSQRKTCMTKLNARSSRSHSMVMLKLTYTNQKPSDSQSPKKFIGRGMENDWMDLCCEY